MTTVHHHILIKLFTDALKEPALELIQEKFFDGEDISLAAQPLSRVSTIESEAVRS